MEYVLLVVNVICIIVFFINLIFENDLNYKYVDILIVIWDICV